MCSNLYFAVKHFTRMSNANEFIGIMYLILYHCAIYKSKLSLMCLHSFTSVFECSNSRDGDLDRYVVIVTHAIKYAQ